MRDLHSRTGTIGGNLLVAHPGLTDPNFNRTVVLISAHSDDDGAIGIILNRPMHQRLEEIRGIFANSPLADVPVYEGGPVNQEDILLTIWKWNAEEGTFQFFFGMDPDRVVEYLEEDPEAEVRAFVGYSGWGAGQVESELKEHAWVITPIAREYFDHEEVGQWRFIIRTVVPELGFLADVPDDPSLN